MKPFLRIEKKIMAQQWFPFVKIDVPGFTNIVKDLFDQQTMQSQKCCNHAEITMTEGVITLNPGDWVIVDAEGKISKRDFKQFEQDYQPIIDSCPIPEDDPQS